MESRKEVFWRGGTRFASVFLHHFRFQALLGQGGIEGAILNFSLDSISPSITPGMTWSHHENAVRHFCSILGGFKPLHRHTDLPAPPQDDTPGEFGQPKSG